MRIMHAICITGHGHWQALPVGHRNLKAGRLMSYCLAKCQTQSIKKCKEVMLAVSTLSSKGWLFLTVDLSQILC